MQLSDDDAYLATGNQKHDPIKGSSCNANCEDGDY